MDESSLLRTWEGQQIDLASTDEQPQAGDWLVEDALSEARMTDPRIASDTIPAPPPEVEMACLTIPAPPPTGEFGDD